MNLFYKKGAYAALVALGLKTSAHEYDEEEQGTPFPEKSPNINAELLARRLRDEDDDKEVIAPENASHSWDRPVTWTSPSNVTGYESGGGAGGLSLPGSPRG